MFLETAREPGTCKPTEFTCATRRHFGSKGAGGERGDIGFRQPRPVLGLHEECARRRRWQGRGSGELGAVAGGPAGGDQEGTPQERSSSFAVDEAGTRELVAMCSRVALVEVWCSKRALYHDSNSCA